MLEGGHVLCGGVLDGDLEGFDDGAGVARVVDYVEG